MCNVYLNCKHLLFDTEVPYTDNRDTQLAINLTNFLFLISSDSCNATQILSAKIRVHCHCARYPKTKI